MSKLAMTALAVAVLASAAVAAEAPPNIILIVADDLGYGHLGCYGQEKIRTLNIDRLAAQGIKFTRFFSGACVCAPARSVLMTGLHTGHTPVRNNGLNRHLSDEDVTIAEVLHRRAMPPAVSVSGAWAGLKPPGSPSDKDSTPGLASTARLTPTSTTRPS